MTKNQAVKTVTLKACEKNCLSYRGDLMRQRNPIMAHCSGACEREPAELCGGGPTREDQHLRSLPRLETQQRVRRIEALGPAMTDGFIIRIQKNFTRSRKDREDDSAELQEEDRL